MKVSALEALVPTRREVPFKLAQLLLLIALIVVGILVARETDSQHVRSV